jgi:hypothetical protein
LEYTMSTTPKTHDDRITDLEHLVLALASDLLAHAQRSREIVGHTLTLRQYLAGLRERGERESAAK